MHHLTQCVHRKNLKKERNLASISAPKSVPSHIDIQCSTRLKRCEWGIINTTANWTLWCLKSPPAQLFVRQFVQTNKQRSIKVQHQWRLCERNLSIIGGFPSQRAIKRSVSMMTSSNVNFSALLALCAGNSPVTGEFRAQRPVTRSFGVFFDLRLNKRLSKQSWGWWFETLSRLLWRHCNAMPWHHHLAYNHPWVENCLWATLKGNIAQRQFTP